ncbi:MAG: EF-hand domain-containing protein [Phycisphaerales bacterium]|nr:EF-hand domain-containing protein [Phycisphaerales bacterium]
MGQRVYIAAVVAAALVTAPCRAGISQATITAPGGFVQAGCYASSSGGGSLPGADLAASFGTGMDFHELSFAGVGPVSTSAAGTSGQITNSAMGEAGMGYTRLLAHNACPTSTFFATGIANGGWKETFTVSHPSHTGQAGYMVFQLRYRGTLRAAGPSGRAGVTTTGYKDNFELVMNPYFDRGGSDPISTDRQRAQWGIASFGATESRTIDGVVTMAVPITFGQSFTLGAYALAAAGQRSSGANPNISTGDVEFAGDGVTWNGIVDVKTAAGASVMGYSVTSGTGIDWTGPYIACLADLSGDGLVDFSDYLEFLNLYDAQDPAVDFNGDGLVDFSDYLEFLNLYEAGC